MKKIIYTLIFVFSLSFTFNIYATSSSKTLGDLKQELKNLQAEQASNNQKKSTTQSQITSDKNSISSKQETIIENQNTIVEMQKESDALTEEIETGKDELENLIETYQLVKSDNSYLEYIFEATSYEDLVYRYAVVEQIMDYETDKIDEWEEKIETNNALKEQLEAEEIELNNQIESLTSDIKALGNTLNSLDDMALDIAADISATKSTISYYEGIGCKDNQTLAECLSVLGDTKFRLPTAKGVITSAFGYRKDPITGATKSFHSGTDIGMSEGSKVYPIANGTVVKIWVRSSCGGNVVFIQHLVAGKKYTSAYMHLLSYNVKVGDKVTSETLIAYSGGYSTSTRHGGYDSCTTGGHLHLSLATGWYGTDYTSYSSFRSHLIDPKTNVPLPNSWSTRY